MAHCSESNHEYALKMLNSQFFRWQNVQNGANKTECGNETESNWEMARCQLWNEEPRVVRFDDAVHSPANHAERQMRKTKTICIENEWNGKSDGEQEQPRETHAIEVSDSHTHARSLAAKKIHRKGKTWKHKN